MRPSLGIIAALGLAAPVGGGCASALVNATVFHPTRPSWPVPIPDGVREVAFESLDGTRLQGFYVEAPGADRVVVYFHGTAGHAALRLPAAAEIARRGSSVFLPEYRGYGRSDGVPHEAGLYADGRAALRYVAEVLGFSPARTVVLGRSLGTAITVEASQDRDYAGVILVTPFTSGRDLASAAGFGPVAWTLGDALDTAARMPRVRCPVMVIHGTEDGVIPVAQGREVHRLAPGRKQLHIVEGAHHYDLTRFAGDLFWDWIRDFVDACAPGQRP